VLHDSTLTHILNSPKNTHTQATRTGFVDMNESAQRLQVPKRRLYEITNILEGVGMVEKRSKNTVAWTGSRALFGSSADDEASKEKIDKLCKEITSMHGEEDLLDRWIARLKKGASGPCSISASDVVEALLYPVEESEHDSIFPYDVTVDETGQVSTSFIAVHAPTDTVALVPKSKKGCGSRRLYVGTGVGARKHKLWQGAATKVSSMENQSAKESQHHKISLPNSKIKLHTQRKDMEPRSDERILVYSLPVSFNDSMQRLESLGAHAIPPISTQETQSGLGSKLFRDVELFACDETVADFFVGGEDEE
jgi:E2F/DP family winged-helix DNA-binding domain